MNDPGMAQEGARGAEVVPPTAWLVDASGREWPLTRQVVACGRASENDLVIESESVSRRHARFEMRNEGYVVVDAGSRNGTTVNDERIGIDESRLLSEGDRVAFGEYRVVYHMTTQPQRSPPTLGRLDVRALSPHTQQLFTAIPEIVRGELTYARIPARGVLNAGTIELFLDACRSTLEHHVSRIVIDAASLDFIDSTSIGGLVRLQRELGQLGGGFAIVAPSPTVRHTIELLHLAAVLPIFPDEARAVAALTPSIRREGGTPTRPADTSTPQLVLPGGQAWPLTGGAVSIGRDIGNDILIDHPGVAAHHAKIAVIGNRHVLLDLPGSGGTHVNGERVHDLYVLHDGDAIEVADQRFEFYAASSNPTPSRSDESDLGADRALGVLLFRELTLTEPQLTIGRAPENQLVIEDSRVSSEHAKIIQSDDKYWLLDLRSSNGTFVNEQRVADVHLLHDGDVISIGATIVTFKERRMHVDDDEPVAPVPPTFVFADASGHRWVRVRILTVVVLSVLVVAAAIFIRFIVQ